MSLANDKTPTMKDLIIASCGRDDINDIPNASCILYTDIFHTDGSDPESVTEQLMVTPEVNIWRHAIFSTIELKFDSKYNKELTQAFKTLTDFTRVQNSMADDAQAIPMIRICVIPNEYAGRYYLLGLNPALWHLSPAGIDGEPRVLTFVVRDEDLLPYDGGEADDESEADTLDDLLASEIEPE